MLLKLILISNNLLINIVLLYNTAICNNVSLLLFNNNKLILTGEYNFFGIYQENNNLWIWASSIPGIKQKNIKYINKIREYSYLFENDNDEKSIFYYQLLTQDILYITDKKMLDWINELLIYLSNDIYYFNPKNTTNNHQFITLSKIIEKYI